MGSDPTCDPESSTSEKLQHTVNLPHYFIARYPVTVAQFQAFVEASGYEWKRQGCQQGLLSHPVVWASWNDALAYCAWLTDRLREWSKIPTPLANILHQKGGCVTLPSEAEWEKAARGTDGRLYPWGNIPDPNKANCSAISFGKTNVVGCIPNSASPYGVEELAGNVWEWTRSIWSAYPYPAEGTERAKREDLQASRGRSRVWRGGSFLFPKGSLRCASRDDIDVNYINQDMGFRVVVTVLS
jgi:formylglycine-generating enzyme required for sulfatase activity